MPDDTATRSALVERYRAWQDTDRHHDGDLSERLYLGIFLLVPTLVRSMLVEERDGEATIGWGEPLTTIFVGRVDHDSVFRFVPDDRAPADAWWTDPGPPLPTRLLTTPRLVDLGQLARDMDVPARELLRFEK
jgi:hypothetical protein